MELIGLVLIVWLQASYVVRHSGGHLHHELGKLRPELHADTEHLHGRCCTCTGTCTLSCHSYPMSLPLAETVPCATPAIRKYVVNQRQTGVAEQVSSFFRELVLVLFHKAGCKIFYRAGIVRDAEH